ncbi:MAG: rhodanese-related sulfurtransferase [Verrucomicrobiota bacterium]|jgi:UPF0176 protein|nr:rhodanese-related sulfurtransferase [Verrucomicrobiota bacterium]MDP7050158.1 rhodanese-related sulfurtransferase [Verrucomicrobiota bacterium]
MEYTVATFYLFADLPDFEAKQAPIRQFCNSRSVLGTIILAPEGINGTIAGPSNGITSALDFLRTDERLTKLPTRLSYTDRKTFHRMRVILRPEIVTLGDPSVNPNEAVGQYVEPENWNELINDPEVTLIDTRNDYEVEVGTFRGAIDPKTGTFGEWPAYVKNNLDTEKHSKIAMFCTGGVRCEKASAHLLKNGFKEVFHLRGGILSYLESVPEAESTWEGDCFVFDHRVAVKHGLEQGDFKICFGCRWPISEADTRSPQYEPGVCCPRCTDELTDERRARLRERHKQVTLARKRNSTHIGEQPRRKPKRETHPEKNA